MQALISHKPNQKSNSIKNISDDKNIIFLQENGTILYASKRFLRNWNIDKDTTNIFKNNNTSNFTSFFIKAINLLQNKIAYTIKQEDYTPCMDIKITIHNIKRVNYQNNKAIQIESNYLNKISLHNFQSNNLTIQLKETFLSLVSHEFRTPLNAILGFSNINIYNQSKDEIKTFLNYINIAGNQLLNLTEDIQYLLKLENSNNQLSNFFFNFDDFRNYFEHSTKHHNMKFQTPYIQNKELNIIYGNYQSLSSLLIKLNEYCLKKDSETDIIINYQQYPHGFGISTIINSPIINFSNSEIDSFTYSCYFDKTQQNISIELDIIRKIIEQLGGKIKIIFFEDSTEITFLFPYTITKKNQLKFKNKNAIGIYSKNKSTYMPLVSFLKKMNIESIFISDLTALNNTEINFELLIFDYNKDIDLKIIDSCYSSQYPIIAVGNNIPNKYITSISKNGTIITRNDYNIPRVLNSMSALI